MASMQAKSGVADDKWEARVREYENRLRIAGEKIKTEKQGGRERAVQLENQIRYVICLLGFSNSHTWRFTLIPGVLDKVTRILDRTC